MGDGQKSLKLIRRSNNPSSYLSLTVPEKYFYARNRNPRPRDMYVYFLLRTKTRTLLLLKLLETWCGCFYSQCTGSPMVSCCQGKPRKRKGTGIRGQDDLRRMPTKCIFACKTCVYFATNKFLAFTNPSHWLQLTCSEETITHNKLVHQEQFVYFWVDRFIIIIISFVEPRWEIHVQVYST